MMSERASKYTVPGKAKGPDYSQAVRLPMEKPEVEVKSLYWFGMLPEAGKFKIKVISDKYDETIGDYIAEKETTSGELFNRVGRNGEDLRMWVGKCRGFQSLAVPGCSFVAWTDKVIRSGDQFVSMPHPGGIAAFTQSQIDKIKYHCGRFVARVRNTDQRKPVWHIVNLDSGKPPETLTGNPDLDRVLVMPKIPMAGDTPVANYVYMVKLDADPTIKDDKYWGLYPTMDQFFKDPPPALAEFVEATAI